MERDFRIEEVSRLTGLTKNYIYTCLKRMPEIFQGVVSTGQHNAKIFREEAIGLFREVSRLKKERLWSLGQIRSHMQNTRSREMASHSIEPLGCGHGHQSGGYEERVEKLEMDNLALRASLESREQEIMEQRRRSDTIILELTSQLRRLSESLTLMQTTAARVQAQSMAGFSQDDGVFEVVARSGQTGTRFSQTGRVVSENTRSAANRSDTDQTDDAEKNRRIEDSIQHPGDSGRGATQG
ncbi:MAG: hypothetical protein CVV64_02650 [Candidatus Wallbacteria bacterium HGW-Wallbacteria-1]|jgi:hypothetical protein|uniref:HTH merR-type domain-containing protein n=1 Tax=Candidatus Wallbacteria bacterium HGW-Wallbacteria-1 TaxID=2013854 RepID=A0A2N1PTE3_9BACT|nr:MAG: hypothetical protein CVV64_02650 [Candidatus Wallbacteria bacterium HGW-Wallbacteria-1]